MSESEIQSQPRTMSRRALIAGAGAGLVAAGTLGTADASARPVPDGDGVAPRTRRRAAVPNGEPKTPTLGSAPLSGYTYRFVGMYDVSPFNPASQRAWGGLGTYANGAGGPLRAGVDVPANALLQDAEFYVSNTSGSTVLASVWEEAAGDGLITEVASVSIPSSTSSIQAARAVVPSAARGPYSIGTKLLLGLTTPSTGTVQFNGARLGFTKGQGHIGFLPAPVRAYDSRSTGGKLKAGETRTVTFPASLLAPGTTGILVNVSVLAPEGGGYVNVYPGNVAAPVSSTVSYQSGQSLANAVIAGVSSARQLKIYTNRAVHVVLDVTGVIA